MSLPADVLEELGPDAVPLESCVCGECYFCPDGYHSNEDMPCICTADCALNEEDDDDE
jgi:hypothetical protein